MSGALIAMSGGVDSSVAALMTIKKHEKCIGATMRLFDHECECECGCKSASITAGDRGDEGDTNSRDAKDICAALGIEHETLDFRSEFRRYVIEKFIRTYESGATPNPCIDCNKNLKFGRLFEAARERGLSEIVTGHYARVEFDHEFDHGRGRWLLKRARDLDRDQSYVLYCMTQEQLAHVHFPLGEFENKNQVRALAEAHGFVNAHRRDSQDICFVPDGDYAKFLERHANHGKGSSGFHGFEPGNFICFDDLTIKNMSREKVTKLDDNMTKISGKILGRHKGIVHYTVGQRKGLGIAAPRPLYVKAIDSKANNIILTANESEIFTRTVFVCDVNFISIAGLELGESIRVTAKLRYRQREQPATATMVPAPGNLLNCDLSSLSCVTNATELLRLDFDEPQRAPARGQAAVFYDLEQSDIVVGGGTICS